MERTNRGEDEEKERKEGVREERKGNEGGWNLRE